jgi:hypothetical protein
VRATLHRPASDKNSTVTPFNEAESAILIVAAHEVDEAWFANWLRQRIRPR